MVENVATKIVRRYTVSLRELKEGLGIFGYPDRGIEINESLTLITNMELSKEKGDVLKGKSTIKENVKRTYSIPTSHIARTFGFTGTPIFFGLWRGCSLNEGNNRVSEDTDIFYFDCVEGKLS